MLIVVASCYFRCLATTHRGASVLSKVCLCVVQGVPLPLTRVEGGFVSSLLSYCCSLVCFCVVSGFPLLLTFVALTRPICSTATNGVAFHHLRVSTAIQLSGSVSFYVSKFCSSNKLCIIPLPLTEVVLHGPRCSTIALGGGSLSFMLHDCRSLEWFYVFQGF